MKDIDLSELTLENVGAWPQQLKVVVISICCMLLLVLGYRFDTSDQLAQLTAKKLTEQELLRQIEVKNQLAINLPAYKQQLADMRSSFKAMLQQLPGRTEVPGLLEDISKAGIASGLAFNLFKPLPENQKEFYAELPIEISVVGNYHQLGQFVSRVSTLDRIVTLHNYTIQPWSVLVNQDKLYSGSERLVMSITAKTYRYTEEQRKATRDTIPR